MKRTTLSPWLCDSDHDYYAQFEEPNYEQDEPEEDWREPEEDWREPEDADCEYWQSNCYGRG